MIDPATFGGRQYEGEPQGMLLSRTVIPRGGISVTEDEDYKCICCILDMCEVQLNEGCTISMLMRQKIVQV